MTCRRLLATLLLLIPPVLVAASEKPDLRPALDALITALNEHDFQAVAPFLDPEFAFAGHGGERGRDILRQVVAGYPKDIEGVEIVSQSTGNHTTAQVRMHLTGGESELHEIDFSTSGLLRRADVVKIQFAGHTGAPPKAPRWSGNRRWTRFGARRPGAACSTTACWPPCWC